MLTRCLLYLAAAVLLALAVAGCPTYTDFMGEDPDEAAMPLIDPDLGTGVLACIRWEYAVWEPAPDCAADRPCMVPVGWEPFGTASEFEGKLHIRRCLANE